jgi:hypothetical protein
MASVMCRVNEIIPAAAIHVPVTLSCLGASGKDAVPVKLSWPGQTVG